MAKLPRHLIAAPVQWTTAQTGSYTTSSGTQAVTFVASGKWTRTWLAPNTGGTSEAAPTDLLRLVQAGLNAVTPGLWFVRLNSSGYVEIEYGGIFTSTLTLSTAIAKALGYSSTTPGPFASGAIISATSHPAWCWLPYSLANDTGWRPSPTTLIAARHADGSVTAYDEGVQAIERAFRADYAPTSEAVRLSRSLLATPYWPPESEPSRWTTPTIRPEAVSDAWTVHESLSTFVGLRLAYTIGDLQALIAGTSTAYTVGYLDPESIRTVDQRAALSIPNYVSLVSVPGFTLTQLALTTQETR